MCSSSATPPPPPDPIPRLLPSGAYPSRAGQGRTRSQAHRAPRDREDRAASRSRRLAPPLRPASCVVQPRRSSVPRNGVTGPRVASSLSLTHRESAGTCTWPAFGRCRVSCPDPPPGRGAWMSDGHERLRRGFGEAQVCDRDNFGFAGRLPFYPRGRNLTVPRLCYSRCPIDGWCTSRSAQPRHHEADQQPTMARAPVTPPVPSAPGPRAAP